MLFEIQGEAVGCKEVVINEKPPEKKVRSYENYIQRKFRPAIMREVLISLSEEQVAWVKRTGFGGILDVRMEKYPHRMGYNVVAVFNAEECMLSLKAGNIKITEDIVHNIIGLPKGKERVIISKDKVAYDFWGLQFPGTLTCKVSPNMVKTKILNSRVADKIFKINFLVLMYNFFIEGNQNRHLMRDIVSHDRICFRQINIYKTYVIDRGIPSLQKDEKQREIVIGQD